MRLDVNDNKVKIGNIIYEAGGVHQDTREILINKDNKDDILNWLGCIYFFDKRDALAKEKKIRDYYNSLSDYDQDIVDFCFGYNY